MFIFNLIGQLQFNCFPGSFKSSEMDQKYSKIECCILKMRYQWLLSSFKEISWFKTKQVQYGSNMDKHLFMKDIIVPYLMSNSGYIFWQHDYNKDLSWNNKKWTKLLQKFGIQTIYFYILIWILAYSEGEDCW